MIFVGVRYNFGAGFSMGAENFYIKKFSADSATPASICADVKSSGIFSSDFFVVKAFAYQRLNLRLYFNIMAYFVQECRNCIANFIVLGECIHLWDSVESGSVWTVVHMGMYVGCLVVPIHISDVISLKSDLLREKLYLFKGSTLSQFDAPFCDARLFFHNFSLF